MTGWMDDQMDGRMDDETNGRIDASRRPLLYVMLFPIIGLLFLIGVPILLLFFVIFR